MYYIRQKVVCIDDSKRHFDIGNLKENSIYTIEGFNPFDDGLVLSEIKSDAGYGAYLRERFMPLSDYAKSQEAIESIFKELELQLN